MLRTLEQNPYLMAKQMRYPLYAQKFEEHCDVISDAVRVKIPLNRKQN